MPDGIEYVTLTLNFLFFKKTFHAKTHANGKWHASAGGFSVDLELSQAPIPGSTALNEGPSPAHTAE